MTTIKATAPPVYTLTGATYASPIVITTSAADNFVTGESILIQGVGGNTAANGTWPITVNSSTQFSLNGSTGNHAYTSGGTAQSSLAWIFDASNPSGGGQCGARYLPPASTPGCDEVTVKYIYFDGASAAVPPVPLATNGVRVAGAGQYPNHGLWQKLYITELNGGTALSMGNAINNVTVSQVDIEPGSVGSFSVGLDLSQGATWIWYHEITVGGATTACIQVGNAGGGNFFGGVCSGNTVDVLVTNAGVVNGTGNFNGLAFNNFWFENS